MLIDDVSILSQFYDILASIGKKTTNIKKSLSSFSLWFLQLAMVMKNGSFYILLPAPLSLYLYLYSGFHPHIQSMNVCFSSTAQISIVRNMTGALCGVIVW